MSRVLDCSSKEDTEVVRFYFIYHETQKKSILGEGVGWGRCRAVASRNTSNHIRHTANQLIAHKELQGSIQSLHRKETHSVPEHTELMLATVTHIAYL